MALKASRRKADAGVKDLELMTEKYGVNLRQEACKSPASGTENIPSRKLPTGKGLYLFRCSVCQKFPVDM